MACFECRRTVLAVSVDNRAFVCEGSLQALRAWRTGWPLSQRIAVENRPLVGEEGLQALRTLRIGCLGLQRVDDEKSQLVREVGLQALRALSADCPWAQPPPWRTGIMPSSGRPIGSV